MKKRQKRQPGINVGTSLILVSFVLLCLVAFAALSYSSAFSDYQLSKQTSDHKKQYYDACNQAEEHLKEIHQILLATLEQSKDEATYQKALLTAFPESPDQPKDTITQTENGTNLSFSIPVNDSQMLKVSLSLPYPDIKNADSVLYEVTEFCTVNQPTKTTGETTISEHGGLLF